MRLLTAARILPSQELRTIRSLIFNQPVTALRRGTSEERVSVAYEFNSQRSVCSRPVITLPLQQRQLRAMLTWSSVNILSPLAGQSPPLERRQCPQSRTLLAFPSTSDSSSRYPRHTLPLYRTSRLQARRSLLASLRCISEFKKLGWTRKTAKIAICLQILRNSF